MLQPERRPNADLIDELINNALLKPPKDWEDQMTLLDRAVKWEAVKEKRKPVREGAGLQGDDEPSEPKDNDEANGE